MRGQALAGIQSDAKKAIRFYAPNSIGIASCPTAGSGLQPESSGLLNTDVCANEVISKDINTGFKLQT